MRVTIIGGVLMALTISLSAVQHQHEAYKSIKGSGKMPQGWQARLDDPSAKPDAVVVKEEKNALTFTTGPAGIYYRPDKKVTGNYELKVTGNLTIDVTGSVTIKSGQSMTHEAQMSMTNKAGVSLTNEAQASITNKGQASNNVESGGMTVIKGALVKIN